MDETAVFHGSEQGFAVVGLRSGEVELRMVPALGGRIIGLRNLRSGREWCWHQPRPDWLWANRAGDDFGKSTQAGIDECVPTVASCLWRGRAIPDHGEVWFQSWELDPEVLEQQILKATVPLTVSPLVFTRAIHAEGGGSYRFDYCLENRGDREEPFLWCIHPLLNIEAGDRMELPAEVRSLRLNGGLGAPISFGDVWNYPEPFPGHRLDTYEIPGIPGGCVKGFADHLATGCAAIVNAGSDARLELSWDPTALPVLGIWINRGLGGFHHVALEPATGAPDSLVDAVNDWGQFRVVPATGRIQWSLHLAIR